MQTATSMQCRAPAPTWSQVRHTTPRVGRARSSTPSGVSAAVAGGKKMRSRLAVAMVMNPSSNQSASSLSKANSIIPEPFLSKEELAEMLPQWLSEGLVFALEFCVEPEDSKSPPPSSSSSMRLWRTAIDFVGISDCDQIIHAISRCRGDYPEAMIRLVAHHPFNSRYKHVFGLVG